MSFSGFGISHLSNRRRGGFTTDQFAIFVGGDSLTKESGEGFLGIVADDESLAEAPTDLVDFARALNKAAKRVLPLPEARFVIQRDRRLQTAIDAEDVWDTAENELFRPWPFTVFDFASRHVGPTRLRRDFPTLYALLAKVQGELPESFTAKAARATEAARQAAAEAARQAEEARRREILDAVADALTNGKVSRDERAERLLSAIARHLARPVELRTIAIGGDQ